MAENDNEYIGGAALLLGTIAFLGLFKNVRKDDVKSNEASIPRPMSLFEISKIVDDEFIFNIDEQGILLFALNTPSFMKKIKKSEFDIVLKKKIFHLDECVKSYHTAKKLQYSSYSLDNLHNVLVKCITNTKDTLENYSKPLSVWASLSKNPLKGPICMTSDLVLMIISTNAIKKAIADFYYEVYALGHTEQETLTRLENDYFQKIKEECHEAINNPMSYFSSYYKDIQLMSYD